MAVRPDGRSSGSGPARKILFGFIVLLGFLAAAEIVGWVLISFTEIGGRAAENPVSTVDDLQRLYPVVDREPIRAAAGVARIQIRDMTDPHVGDQRRWLDSPPDGETAVILGGSSPFGAGLKNKDTFWRMLDEADESDLTYLNVSSIGDRSRETRGQIAWFVGFGGRPRFVVVYTGDNEWNGFRYPNLKHPAAGRLDSIMLRSKAYASLRTLVRSAAQSSVYESVERARRGSNFSLTRFPLDTRYRGFDEHLRAFVDESRARILAGLVANIEAVIEFSRANGARVILVVNPIKYRLSPAHNIAQVVSEQHAGTRVEDQIVDHLDTAVNALLASELAAAEKALEAAYEIDPLSSITNHYLGYYWEAAGDPRRARTHFMTARDRTIGAGGLMAQINQAIRDVAVREEVRVVDLEAVFLRHTDVNGNGLADELVMDWCHPSQKGARVVFEELRPVMVSEDSLASGE